MSFEQTDVGELTQRFGLALTDQAFGNISASVSENEGAKVLSEDQQEDEPKYNDCHIFDYQKFKNEKSTRLGSEKDVARLSYDFQKLKFNVYDKYLNLSKQQTLDALKQAAKNVHKDSKCFVCCFLTHGCEGILLMQDKYIKIEEILKCFSRSACENLAGKPKIFIFQACRGNCCEEKVSRHSADSGSEIDIPDYLDFLLVYSTYEGSYSFKTESKECLENNHGSFFIDEFCRTLEQFSSKLDLLQILTIVNYRVAHFYTSHTRKEKTNQKKQMPNFVSQLRTKIEFNRPIPMYVTDDTIYFNIRRSGCSLGYKSNKNPLEDKKIYNIQKSSRIRYLSLSNTEKNKFGRDLDDCLNSLKASVAAKNYKRSGLQDWSKSNLMDFLKKVAAQDCSNIDCLICFVACQAKGDYLLDKNGNRFKKRDIVEKFTGKVCEDLIGKPKIFIFLMFSPLKTSIRQWFCSADGEDTIPVHSDILEVAITVEEVRQLEGVKEKFCNIFGKENSEDFLSLLTKMNDELVRDHEFYSPSSEKSATFCFNSTLTETLILNQPKCKSK